MQNYEDKRKLNIGRYSSIYKVKNIKTKQYVAIKEIDKSIYKINIEELKKEIKKNEINKFK